MHRTLTVAVLALATATPGLRAQNVETVRLEQPAATFPEPLSSPAGFRALSDGRVILSDNTEQVVAILDFGTGEMTPIGRMGGGPGEYGMPGPLFAAGDSTFMFDMGNRRLAVITPEGQIASATISLRHPSGWPIMPRGADREGRIYFDLAGIAMPGLNDMVTSGRAPLLRWDRATDQLDTVAFVNFPPMPAVGPGEVRISIGGTGPYQPRDAWSVGQDGRVGIARAQGYRVEWQGGTAPIVGPELEYQPVRITDAEKNAWADQMAARGMMVEIENGRRRTRRPPRPNIDQMEWPEFMPPFTGIGGVLIAPNGELWIRRVRPAGARNATYDVFGSRGNLVRQVVLSADRSVLGFGPTTVFVARTDEDDLQWIEQHRLN